MNLLFNSYVASLVFLTFLYKYFHGCHHLQLYFLFCFLFVSFFFVIIPTCLYMPLGRCFLDSLGSLLLFPYLQFNQMVSKLFKKNVKKKSVEYIPFLGFVHLLSFKHSGHKVKTCYEMSFYDNG